jgi:polyhydroxyalkanoate synthesis regulator protein
MANYMEQSLKLFMTQQQNIRGQVKRVVGVDPLGAVADIAQKNFSRWKSLQDEVLQRLMRGSRDSDDDSSTAEDRKKAG